MTAKILFELCWAQLALVDLTMLIAVVGNNDMKPMLRAYALSVMVTSTALLWQHWATP